MTVETQGTAAASGAGATARFRENKHFSAATSQERVSKIAGRVIKAINDTVLEEEVSYDEYNALKAWLIKVGEDGEWPLFLDVWVEHVSRGSGQCDTGTAPREAIEGPYYLPNSPECSTPRQPCRCATTNPAPRSSSRDKSAHVAGQRPPGRQDRDSGMQTICGFYSQFAPGLPRMEPPRHCGGPDQDGSFQINTMQPGAIPDPHGRCLRTAHRRGRLARVAPGAPAPQSVGSRGISSSPPSCTSQATNTWRTISLRP